MRKDKEKKVWDLCESIVTLAHITCDNCGNEAEDEADTFDAAEGFYNEGWRNINDVTLCPTCFKNKNVTRKERILKMLKRPGTKLTCQAICKKIIKADKLEGNIALYLSGSISSILAKLVKEKVLRYSELEGPRGGHIYEFNLKK